MRQDQYFFVNILAFYSVYLEVQKPIQNHHDFAKFSFNFNFNFVESWDIFILNSSMPANHPPLFLIGFWTSGYTE